MIPFNIPPFTGNEIKYIEEAVKRHKISGDGEFTKRCSKWMEDEFGAGKVLLTTSGTAALDMALLLCDLKPGDEVILPSYTFSSTANAAVLAGAKLVFVDVRPDTMNIDEKLIEAAVTDRTRAIIAVHYAGVACEMDEIMAIAKRHDLKVIEDAAQGIMSQYKGRYLGTIGDFGCYSFHETKNYSMGEGGAIVINAPEYIERAEILREKGTNRSKFFRGQVDKYTWVDFGDSYLPAEINSAYLWAQLENAKVIYDDRMSSWKQYYDRLIDLQHRGQIELPFIPDECVQNGHMFYLKVRNLDVRTRLIEYLKQQGIMAVFHYIPLHSAPAGMKYGEFHGDDKYTTSESERLLRLPLYYGLQRSDLEYITDKIRFFLT